MAINRKRANIAYGLDSPLQSLSPEPIIAQRAPGATDFAQLGVIWLDQSGNEVYVLLEIVANVATWLQVS